MTYIVITTASSETYITKHNTIDEALIEYKGRITYMNMDDIILARIINVQLVPDVEEE